APRHFTDRLHSEGYLQFPSDAGFNCQLGWMNKRNTGWREGNLFAFRFVKEGDHVNISMDIATREFRGAGGGEGVITAVPIGAPGGWVGVNNVFIGLDNIVRPKHEFGWTRTLPHLDGLDGYTPMYNLTSADRHAMGGVIYLGDFGMKTYQTEQDLDAGVYIYS